MYVYLISALKISNISKWLQLKLKLKPSTVNQSINELNLLHCDAKRLKKKEKALLQANYQMHIQTGVSEC